jgi:molybdopterin-guanine dinucleotide biosynthesis protein A
MSKIAGVVLAGGKSSRMGRDKALLLYQGRPMIDTMIDLLQGSGCTDVFVSGDRSGYHCIPDREQFQGPAAAMRHVLEELSAYQGVLFVPVDMPLLTVKSLQLLTARKSGAFFEGHFLPVYIAKCDIVSTEVSVHEFLKELGIASIPCPADADKFLVNLNTPEDWQTVS